MLWEEKTKKGYHTIRDRGDNLRAESEMGKGRPDPLSSHLQVHMKSLSCNPADTSHNCVLVSLQYLKVCIVAPSAPALVQGFKAGARLWGQGAPGSWVPRLEEGEHWAAGSHVPWVSEAPCSMKQGLAGGQSQPASLELRAVQVRGPDSADGISW